MVLYSIHDLQPSIKHTRASEHDSTSTDPATAQQGENKGIWIEAGAASSDSMKLN